MNNKIYIAFLYILLAPYFLISQGNFVIKLLPTSLKQTGISNLMPFNNKYLGRSIAYETPSIWSVGTSYYVLDSSFNVIDHKFISDTIEHVNGSDYANGFFKDGYFYFTSSTFTNPIKIYADKLDSDLNLIERVFLPSCSDDFENKWKIDHKIFQLENGNIVAVTGSSELKFNPSNGKFTLISKGCIIYLDDAMNILNNFYIPTTEEFPVANSRDGIALDDGSALILSTNRKIVKDPVDINSINKRYYKYWPSFSIVNQDGVVFHMEDTSYQYISSLPDMISTSDKGYLISLGGGEYYKVFDPFNPFYYQWLVRDYDCFEYRDSQLNKLWKFIPNPYTHMSADQKSGLCEGFNKEEYIGLINGTDSVTYDFVRFRTIQLVSFNAPGIENWRREYNFASGQVDFLIETFSVDEILKVSDGYLFSGMSSVAYAFADSGYCCRALVGHVDSFGCLVPGCQLSGVDDPTPEAISIRTWPNPCTENLYVDLPTIDAATITLMDASGKKILVSHQAIRGTQHTFDVSQVPAGFYLLNVVEKSSGYTGTKKIVVAH